MLRLSLVAALAVSAAFTASASAASITQLEGPAGCLGPSTSDCKPGTAVGGTDELVVSPDGRHVYVAANLAQWGAVLSFSRDTTTGEIRQLPGKKGCFSYDGRTGQEDDLPKSCDVVPTVSRATDVEISPDGRTVYTLGSDYFVEAIDVWRRNPDTGELTLLECWSGTGANGCKEGEFIEPNAMYLTPDGRRLVLGGGSLSSFTVGEDGRLGSDRCFYRFWRGTGGARKACASAPRYSKRFTISSLEGPTEGAGSKVYAIIDGFNGASGRGGQIARFNFNGDRTALAAAQCAGSARDAGSCKKLRAFGYPDALAVSPHGSGVYSAGYDFTETDEETGDGFIRGSGLSVFTSGLRQLRGKSGCVMFSGRRNEGCATRPKAHGAGFTGAGGIEVTPGGGFVLGGFSGAVAMLKRSDSTQRLTPIAGTAACVAEAAARKKCSPGHSLRTPRAFAFSPDGRFAYAAAGDVLLSFSLVE